LVPWLMMTTALRWEKIRPRSSMSWVRPMNDGPRGEHVASSAFAREECPRGEYSADEVSDSAREECPGGED
jgi:hypothetical protein